MSFLKNIVKNAVSDGIGKGIRDAVGSAVEKAVNPAAERWADATAKQIDSSAQMINSSAEAAAQAADTIAAETANASGQPVEKKNPFENLQRAAENYARTIEKQEEAAKHVKFNFPVLDGTGKPYVNDVLKLVADNKGFAVVFGFKEWTDHCIGGKDNKFWYSIENGAKTECYIAEYVNGAWSAQHFTKIDSEVTRTESDAGTVFEMMAQRLYLAKNANLDGVTPVEVEKCGYKCLKFTKNFGALSYTTSVDFDVTVEFSDCDKPDNGYMLRYFCLGEEVSVPDFSEEE